VSIKSYRDKILSLASKLASNLSLLYALNYASVSGLLQGDDAQANRDAIVASGPNALDVAVALNEANTAGLLQGEGAQANRNAIVASGPNAKTVASALNCANEAGLIQGDDAQANRDTIVASGPNALDVAYALNEANEAGLLQGEGAQANRNAIVASGPNAIRVVPALNCANEAGLLQGEGAQANRDAIAASGLNAIRVVPALNCANEAGLLQGDDAQTNRDTIVASGPNALGVAYALNCANEAGLLQGDDAQANRDAIVDSGPNAIRVASALKWANEAGLLQGDDAQTNRDAIVASGPNALGVAYALKYANEARLLQGDDAQANHIAYALNYANKAGLLQGDDAQANRDAIVTSGLNAKTVAYALYYANTAGLLKAGLLQSDDAQANRAAIAASGPNAKAVGDALKCANEAGLLQGEGAQVNRNAIVASRPNAWAVAFALNGANEAGLLQGEGAQANFNAIVASGPNAYGVAYALNDASELGLLQGEGAQANRDAIVAFRSNAESIVLALLLANNSNLMSEEKRQARFDAIIKSSNEGCCKLARIGTLRSYPALINEQTWHDSVKLNENEARAVGEGLKVIERHNPEMVSLANYKLLLKAGEQANTVAALLTGTASENDFTLFGENRTEHAPQKQYELYKAFSTKPHQVNLDQISGLKQLNDEQALKLLQLISKTNLENLFTHLMTGTPEDIVVHILAEQYLLTYLYHDIPKERRADLPRANDNESSMRDDYISLARERINLLSNDLDFEPEQLEETEVDIRRFLLQAIQSELEVDKNNANENEKALLEEKIKFIKEHCEELAKRKDDVSPTVIANALQYFSSPTSTSQTAWRAYEPTAPCFQWPNLFTRPAPDSASNPVFSTRVSAAGQESQELTKESASREARIWSAICFLASKAHPEMRADYIYCLAEIRRAHNDKPNELDDPSCQPGTLSRFLTATNKHPRFSREKTPVDAKQIVSERVRSFVQSIVNHESRDKTGEQARLMLTALYLYSPKAEQNNEVLRDRSAIDNVIYATAEDLKTPEADADEQKAHQSFLKESQILRRNLMVKILGKDGALLYNAVVEGLNNAELPHDNPEELRYLIAKHMAGLGAPLSLPYELLESARPSIKATEPVQPQGTSKSEAFRGALLQVAIEHNLGITESLNDAISGLLSELSDELSNWEWSGKDQALPVGVVKEKFKNVQDAPKEFTEEFVCSALERVRAPPSIKAQDMKAALNELRNAANEPQQNSGPPM